MFLTITRKNQNHLPAGLLKKEEVEQELMANPFGKYLIYCNQEKVVGYLYYSDIYDRVEINQFEVEKEKRNSGIGTRILEQFTKTVEKEMTLEVKEDNFPAIHLYEKFGFSKVAIRKGYYQGVDGILMERKSSQGK